MARMAETLSPIRRMVSGRGADEDEAALLDALGEVGVLRQEAVAGMDRDRVGDFGGG
jgi:cyanophycinase-like exopeptidase